MSKFRVLVSDTVAYERSQVVEIEADDLISACEIAVDKALAGDFHGKWDEVEVDNTPYEACEADSEI